MKFLMILMAVVLVSACKKQDIVANAHYVCDQGIELDTTFTNGKAAKIVAKDMEFNLDRVESETGAKYETDGIVFWSKGRDANFVMVKGTEPLKCWRE